MNITWLPLLPEDSVANGNGEKTAKYGMDEVKGELIQRFRAMAVGNGAGIIDRSGVRTSI
jgi:hypothetical protein